MDGEGCFDIPVHKGGSPACRFKLVVRDDDAAIVEEIQAWLGFGNVRRSRPNRGKPSIGLQILAKGDCLRLVEILDQYPLRAKKARDYAIWRQAVIAWQSVAIGRGAKDQPPQRQMVALRHELAELRKYPDSPLNPYLGGGRLEPRRTSLRP